MGESRGASGSMRWLALTTVYLVWGSTYLAIRVVVRTIPAFLSAGSRFVVAGLLLAAVLGVRRGWPSLRISRREFGACTTVGALLLLGGNGLVVVAEQHIASGLAALVVAAVPLWIVLMRLAARDRPRNATVGAVLAGFGGIAVLLAPGGGRAHVLGILTVLAASLSWSIGSFNASRLPLPKDPFVTAVYEMLAGGTLMLLVSLARGEPMRFHPSRISGESAGAWVYLVVAGALVAYTAYVWLLQNAPISLVATYAYVNPTVAVLLGALFLGEHVGWPILVGGAIVVASVACRRLGRAAARRRSAGALARARGKSSRTCRLRTARGSGDPGGSIVVLLSGGAEQDVERVIADLCRCDWRHANARLRHVVVDRCCRHLGDGLSAQLVTRRAVNRSTCADRFSDGASSVPRSRHGRRTASTHGRWRGGAHRDPESCCCPLICWRVAATGKCPPKRTAKLYTGGGRVSDLAGR